MDISRDFKDFKWTDANAVEVERIIGRYPKGRETSAIMPLLWLAQGFVETLHILVGVGEHEHLVAPEPAVVTCRP